MIEEWKDIEGYEGMYAVSNIGNVMSIKRLVAHSKNGTRPTPAKDLIGGINTTGYRFISLYRHGKVNRMMVHRLVSMAFIPNPNNKSTVNHKDGNKLNNAVSNLEWASYKENMDHAHKTGLMKHLNRDIEWHIAHKKIVKYHAMLTYGGVKRICDFTGLCKAAFHDAINGRTPSNTRLYAILKAMRYELRQQRLNPAKV